MTSTRAFMVFRASALRVYRGSSHRNQEKKIIIQPHELLSPKALLDEPLSPKVHHCSAGPTCRGGPRLVKFFFFPLFKKKKSKRKRKKI